VAEGIGQSRITANLESAPIDTQFRISDEEGLEQVFALLKHEGPVPRPVVGHQRRRRDGAGARAWVRASTIVTILCDSGMRDVYLSTRRCSIRRKSHASLPGFPRLSPGFSHLGDIRFRTFHGLIHRIQTTNSG
jgi:hypothetical protein